MRARLYVAAVLALLSALPAAAQPQPAGQSPAERAIRSAREAIAKSPEGYQTYNDLALALARRARETADSAYYTQAGKALEKSFALSPGNFEGERTRAWILLGGHAFAKALELAKELQRRMPDDVTVYGLLADAHVELGNYKEAEEAAQWMLDLSRSGVPALTRAAHLRELFGDHEGALELMVSAYGRVSPAEVEDRAWILTHIAHLKLLRGAADEADRLLQEALQLFPGYHYALANVAKARFAQGKHSQAVELLRQRYQAAPHPENLYDLALALERAGRNKEAEQAFAEFESKARAEMEQDDNANRELIFYYADHARKPAEALRTARREIARRRDVYTLDAFAWALFVNTRYAEARSQIEAALAVGIRDAKLYYHAGAIASKTNNRTAAVRRLEQSLELNSRSEVAAAARQALSRLVGPATAAAQSSSAPQRTSARRDPPR